jgi:single-strand selective monofunctional uracil DNA glycosylase
MPKPSSPIGIAQRLRKDVSGLRFGPPVYHVYNPLTYAWAPHRKYLARFGKGTHPVLIVGMNPGYFGMVQTGVPFGDVTMVRDWLAIHERVRRPQAEHPKRPIAGFACRRREISGQRLWGWAGERFRTPERFFETFFVLNYCPLCFLGKSGAIRTPDKLPAHERALLFAACDRALLAAADALGAHYAIGLGRFAERRVAKVLGERMTCGGAPHPSPANAQAGRRWAAEMDRALGALGLHVPSG